MSRARGRPRPAQVEVPASPVRQRDRDGLLDRHPGLLLHVAAVATLVLAYLAAVGAITRGATPLDLNVLYDEDTTRTWLLFRDLFLVDEYAASGWVLGNNLFIPDYLLLAVLYGLALAMGVGKSTAIIGAPLVAMLLFALVSAYGWRAVAQRLFGQDSVRPTVALVLHAVPFVCVALGQADYFVLWFLPVYHNSTWVLLPWLLALLIKAVRVRRLSNTILVHCALLLALTMASDLLTLMWFTLPAAGAIALVTLPDGGLPRIRAGRILLALAAGSGGGLLLDLALPFHELQRFSLGFKDPWEHLGRLAGLWGRLVVRVPEQTLVIVIFAILVVRRGILTLLATWRGDDDIPAGAARTVSQAFIAYFLPASMLVCLVAAVLSGNVEEYKPHWADYLGRELRYIQPTVYLPLFVGWVLLPMPKLPREWRPQRVLAVATGILAASGSATLAYGGVQLRNLDVFATEFSTCFATLAREYGWQAGIGSIRFMPLMLNPELGIDRYLPIGIVYKNEPGESAIYLDWTTANRNWFKGEFDFVIVNKRSGRGHFYPPTKPGQDGCHMADFINSCAPAHMHGFLIDTDKALLGFGRPAAAHECGDVAFLHYDPPLQYDFSGPTNRLGTAVALGL